MSWDKGEQWTPQADGAGAPADLQFWGGPYDGQTQRMPPSPDPDHVFRFPVWVYNQQHRPLSYNELYARDGAFLRYRGAEGKPATAEIERTTDGTTDAPDEA